MKHITQRLVLTGLIFGGIGSFSEMSAFQAFARRMYASAALRLTSMTRTSKLGLFVAGTGGVATATMTRKPFTMQDLDNDKDLLADTRFTVENGTYPLPAQVTLKTRNGSHLYVNDAYPQKVAGCSVHWWNYYWALNKNHNQAQGNFSGNDSEGMTLSRTYTQSFKDLQGNDISNSSDRIISSHIRACTRNKCVDFHAPGDLIDVRIDKYVPTLLERLKCYVESSTCYTNPECSTAKLQVGSFRRPSERLSPYVGIEKGDQ